MLARSLTRFWGPAAALLLLAACNRPDLVDPTATPSPRPLSLEEIETAVVATLQAEGTIARPSDTSIPAKPSATPTELPSETPTASSTPAPKCTVVSNFLNLRSGPGIAYDPPLRTVTSGTMLFPFARNADGSWLEGRQEGDSQTFWFSAAGQFTSCESDLLALPLGAIPPTPTPTKTLTPTPTLTPSPTDKPTTAPPANTPCPKYTNPSLTASIIPGSSKISVTWGSSGGCGPFTGTINATYIGDSSPYATYEINGQSGKLTDSPKVRCGGTIVYVLTLKDSSGQTVTVSNSDIYWLC